MMEVSTYTTKDRVQSSVFWSLLRFSVVLDKIAGKLLFLIWSANHSILISCFGKTLEYLSEKYDLNYYNLKGLHIFSKKKLSKIKLNFTKLTRFGLHNIFTKRLKSKMWDDHVNLNSIK